MADTLTASLLADDRRSQVVADLQTLVDQEVAAKNGLSGGVIKTGYAAVKKVRPGIVARAVNSLLEDFSTALEPHWAAYRTQPAPGFGAFLAARPQEVSQALLEVTDRRAAKYTNRAVASAYSKMRPKAQDNVIEALPKLGDVLERHAG